MAEIVFFHVKRVPNRDYYAVCVNCRRKTYRRFIELDDPEERKRFLRSVYKKRLQQDYDRKQGMDQLRLMLKIAIEAMHLRHGIPILQPAAEVTATDVRWLWPQTIPAGKLTLVIGDPGAGKTFFALDVAARVTQGDHWPDDLPHAPLPKWGNVLLLSAEDDAGDTLVPRLEAQGADLERITLLEGIEKSEQSESKRLRFSLVTMLDQLEQSVERLPNCRLVIVDPISAYLQGVSARRNTDVRDLLAPLAELARKHKVAVLAVNHLNKNLGGPLIYRSLGSLAFAAAARAVWAVVRDPRDRERRLLVPVKNNLAQDAHALAFRLEACEGYRAPSLCWEDKRLTLAELAMPSAGPTAACDSRRAPQRTLAIQWLQRQLTSGQRASTELFAAARIEDISEMTLRRAFRELGGAARKASTGHWVWMLPAPRNNVTNMTNLTKLDAEELELPEFPDVPALRPPPSALRTDVTNMTNMTKFSSQPDSCATPTSNGSPAAEG